MNKIKNFFNKITTNKSVGQLVFRSIMMIVVPYIYLYVCGFIDNVLLKRGFAYREGFILFVFFSLMLFWLIALILIGVSIYKYVRRDKTPVKIQEKASKEVKQEAVKAKNHQKSSKQNDIKIEK